MSKSVFTNLYAVGDSLSDNGGIYQLSTDVLDLVAAAHIPTGGLTPIPPPPYAQDFSNGPVLPVIEAQLLGATLHDFAFGGATATGTLTFGQLAQNAIPSALLPTIEAVPGVQDVFNHEISLQGQLNDLTASLGGHPAPQHSALVSLIGLNDLQSLEGTYNPADLNSFAHVATLVAQTVPGIVAANHNAAETAFNDGIDTVIFETLPHATFFPAGQALPPELQTLGNAAIDAVNLGLKADALLLRHQGHDVRVVDIAKMADTIQHDPAGFGFQNFNVPWSLGDGIHFVPSLPPAALDTTAFFDPLHPTTNLHNDLAEFAAASLTAHGNHVTVDNHQVPIGDTALPDTNFSDLLHKVDLFGFV
jgi:phospholipase/lecithinase/hemolysin